MPKSERHSERPLHYRVMWFVILWLVGFGGTVLLAMPFHYLVMASLPR
jgi:hypothetical protein